MPNVGKPVVPLGGGIVTSQSPPYAVPVRYMLLGVVCFGLFAVFSASNATHLATGDPGAPTVVAMTHLLTLGALLSFVMGAVYQLTTVAFLIPISSVPLARWNFWLYLIGLVGLFLTMDRWWTPGFLIFGIIMAIAVYVYAFVMIASLWQTKEKGAMWGLVVSAHGYLILAVSVAVLLVLVDSGVLASWNPWMGPLVGTHILLAAGGYFTFLVMGFSLKLFPMFTLSHGFSTKRQKWTLTLAHLSLWLFLAAVWTSSSLLIYVASIVGVFAAASHLLDIRGIFRKRLRKRIEPPIGAVVGGVSGAAFALIWLMVQLAVGPGPAGWQTVVMLYLLGAISFMVMGFAYKIVPFLVWTQRYSKPKADGKPVLISQLINLDTTKPVFVGFPIGLLLLAVSSSLQWKTGAVAGAVVMGLAVVVFAVQILGILDLRKIGKELTLHD